MMCTVFWDWKGILLIDFLPRGQTIKADGGQHFNNDEELKENVSNWLKTQAANFYEEGIQKLVPRYEKCLRNFGSYVEK